MDAAHCTTNSSQPENSRGSGFSVHAYCAGSIGRPFSAMPTGMDPSAFAFSSTQLNTVDTFRPSTGSVMPPPAPQLFQAVPHVDGYPAHGDGMKPFGVGTANPRFSPSSCGGSSPAAVGAVSGPTVPAGSGVSLTSDGS